MQVLAHLTIETEQEEDGRWIAEVLEMPGVLVYGDSQQITMSRVQALALRVIADKLHAVWGNYPKILPRPRS